MVSGKAELLSCPYHVKHVGFPGCLVIGSSRPHHQLPSVLVTVDDIVRGLAFHCVKRPGNVPWNISLINMLVNTNL